MTNNMLKDISETPKPQNNMEYSLIDVPQHSENGHLLNHKRSNGNGNHIEEALQFNFNISGNHGKPKEFRQEKFDLVFAEQKNIRKNNNIDNAYEPENFSFTFRKNKKCCYCAENVDEKEDKFLDCQCLTHFECLKNYVEIQITMSKVANICCPSGNCSYQIPYDKVTKFISKENVMKEFDSLYASSLSGFVPLSESEEYYTCLTPNCSNGFVGFKNEIGLFNCDSCKKSYCLKCKVDYHEGKTCDEFNKA